MRIAVFACLLLTVAACQDGGAADQLARDTAKGVVNGIVENRFPGVNAAPFTDCIIDNAEIAEVYTIAEAAVVGPTTETTSLIIDIARRPETLQCATDNALGAFLLGV